MTLQACRQARVFAFLHSLRASVRGFLSMFTTSSVSVSLCLCWFWFTVGPSLYSFWKLCAGEITSSVWCWEGAFTRYSVWFNPHKATGTTDAEVGRSQSGGYQNVGFNYNNAVGDKARPSGEPSEGPFFSPPFPVPEDLLTALVSLNCLSCVTFSYIYKCGLSAYSVMFVGWLKESSIWPAGGSPWAQWEKSYNILNRVVLYGQSNTHVGVSGGLLKRGTKV